MSGGHGGNGRTLYRDGHSPIHRLPAHLKLVALVGFILVVVSTPADRYWVFAGHVLVLAVVLVIARIPPGYLAPKLVIETPFLLFAALLPFVARSEQVEVLGLSVAQAGLVGGAALVLKATLALLASVTLAATTTPEELVRGLERLRMPQVMISILQFMLRYLDVVAEELARMRIARESRAFTGRRLRHLRVVGHAAGALFVRSYERGERVHLSMLSRGYTGTMPDRIRPEAPATAGSWAAALAVPGVALAVLLSAVVTA